MTIIKNTMENNDKKTPPNLERNTTHQGSQTTNSALRKAMSQDAPGVLKRFDRLSASVPLNDQEANDLLREAGINADESFARLLEKLALKGLENEPDYPPTNPDLE